MLIQILKRPKRLTTQPSQRLPKRLTQRRTQQPAHQRARQPSQQLTQILTISAADAYQPAGNPVNLQTSDLIQSRTSKNIKSTLES